MTNNCVYFTPCCCDKEYKGKTPHSLKLRLQEYQKAVCQGEIAMSGMTKHKWKEKRNNLPLWDEVKIREKNIRE